MIPTPLTSVFYYLGWVLTAIEFVSFIIAICKAIKNKQYNKVKELAVGFIQEAENLTAKNGSPVSGITKKEVVLAKIRTTCANLHMSYDDKLWNEVVDQLVEFTLRVNSRDTDKAKLAQSTKTTVEAV